MITELALTLLTSGFQDKGQYYPKADILMIARSLDYAGTFTRRCEQLDEVIVLNKYRFRPVLTVRGTPLSGDFEAVGISDIRPATNRYKRESLYMIALTRPDASGTLPGFSEWRYRPEREDQLALADFQPCQLPEATYELVGNTEKQSVTHIYARAFQASQNADYLNLISTSGKGELQFYTDSIEPILLRAATGNDVLRARVLWTSQAVGKVDRREELRTLVGKIDRETENVDADLPPFPAAFSDEIDYLQTMLHARTTAFRVAAINAFEVKPERRDLIISMLGDSKKRVRYYAIKWLYKLHEEGAPQPKCGANETIENEAEVIAYWRGR